MGIASLFHHPSVNPATAGAARPAATATSGSSGSSSSTSSSAGASAATISANDFLTLLVTEMQNQDPTANTDPNEYVNQLVNVNSLEQLISINQTLSSAVGSSGSGSSGTASGGSVSATGNALANSNPSTQAVLSAPHVSAHVAQPTNELMRVNGTQAPGNLSIPGANPAAMRVAQALGGGSKFQK